MRPAARGRRVGRVMAARLALTAPRRRAWLIGLVGVLAAASVCGGSAADAGQPALKAVRYLGHTFAVPASWQVIDNRRHPRGCVRFDQHAVYLGRVGSDEFCPSWLIGTTEAMVFQPAPAGAIRAVTANPVERQIVASAAGISVTATFDADPAIIFRILASASLPVPGLAGAGPAGLPLAGLRNS